MSTAFKQTSNGAKCVVASNALNNTTSPLTFSVQTGKGALFPQPGNGFYVTAYNSVTYSDPNDDPNMRIGLCTARSTDSLTVTWGQFSTPINVMAGTPDLRLLPVSQLFTDYSTAINALEVATGISGTNMASPSITGTVTGGASYTAPTITNPTITGGGSWAGSPTLTTPTIASLTNAQHTHLNADGGGALGTAIVLDTPTVRNWNGWEDANESWTFASATTITVPSDATTKYSVGDKIKLTQSATVKYFYIVGVTSTVLTITGGTDYTLTNNAITLNYYSKSATPLNFPHWFNYAPTVASGTGTLTTTTITVAKFSIMGRTCTVTLSFTYTNAGTGASVTTVTSPVTAVTGGAALMVGSGREVLSTGSALEFYLSDTVTFSIWKYDNTTIIATGRGVAVNGTYPI